MFFFFFFVFWSCIALYLSEIAMMLLSLLFSFVSFFFFFAPSLELILKVTAGRTFFYHCWVLKKISNTSQFLISEKGTSHRSSPPGFSAKQAWKETKRPSRAARTDERRLYFQATFYPIKVKIPYILIQSAGMWNGHSTLFNFLHSPKARSYNRHLKWSPYKCNEHNSISYFFWDIFAFRVQGE